MKDSIISRERILLLHPNLRAEVMDVIDEIELLLPANTFVRITQTLRTIEEQNHLYEQGRSVVGKLVTNARGGRSFHNYGMSFDFVLIEDGMVNWNITNNWMIIVNKFKERGWEWGGDWRKFKDYPHLQKTFGYTWRELLKKYNNKDFIPGTKYLNL